MPTVDVVAANAEVDQIFSLVAQANIPTLINKVAKESGQRPGQWVFNWMYAEFPDLANFYRGALIDCFYKDSNIPAFTEACLERFMAIYDVEG